MRRKKKKIKFKIKIKHKEVILLCIAATVIITASVAMVVAGTDPNRPEVEQSVMLDRQDSGLVFADEPQYVPSEDANSDQPVQSINFRQDMSVRDALRFLAAKYHKNIIPSTKVNGKLNVTSLYEVTFDQALQAVLGEDCRYDVKGDFIKVYDSDEYNCMVKDESRMSSRIYTLYYTNSSDIQKLIAPLMSKSGQIAAVGSDSSSSSSDSGGGSSSSSSSSSSSGGDSSSGSTSGDGTAMRDTIVVYDFPERLDKISETIKIIDVQPQQILVEVTILTATLTETTNFGINWSKIASLTSVSTPLKFTADLSNAAATAFTATLNNDEITAAITAQEDVVDTTVLANPKVIALNRQAGYINIGTETGYTESTTQNSTGTTSSVAFLETGTILRFKPFICDNGYIRMEISPEESTASPRTAGTTVVLDKTITTLQTNIMVKDGRTIIIGGLFKEDLTNTDKQVPVAGDLPIVGGLFKSTSDKNIRKELVILITPHIIKESQELEDAAKSKHDDVGRIVGGSRKRISWISRTRIYDDSYAKAVQYYSEKNYKKALAELNWIISFRPEALEAVRLRDKILAETKPDEYKTLERIMLEEIRKEQEVMWERR